LARIRVTEDKAEIDGLLDAAHRAVDLKQSPILRSPGADTSELSKKEML